ncbi:TPA: DUF2513 domain-containing protein [Escherichia coli]
MKIDYDEIARIFDVFLEADTAFIRLEDVGWDRSQRHSDSHQKLVFHLLLLVENGFISNRYLETGTAKSIGLTPTSLGYSYSGTSVRLTQDGHDFAKALHQKPILERIKQHLADAPMTLVTDVGKQWLTSFLKKKLGIE